jgi:hypothetical protein
MDLTKMTEEKFNKASNFSPLPRGRNKEGVFTHATINQLIDHLKSH